MAYCVDAEHPVPYHLVKYLISFHPISQTAVPACRTVSTGVKTGTLGSKLTKDFIERQLGGSNEHENANGTRFTIVF